MLEQEQGEASPVVSSDAEELVLVDEGDNEIGHLDKASCHDGSGVLHRAFSLFVFDDQGRVLLQRRSASKRLWPLYWSNSCCSHPRRGESMSDAVSRRLEQELGLRADLGFLYKFRYHAPFGEAGSERELCWVYAGTTRGRPDANPNEIASWRFVEPDALAEDLRRDGGRYTPWLRLEWQRLEREFRGKLAFF